MCWCCVCVLCVGDEKTPERQKKNGIGAGEEKNEILGGPAEGVRRSAVQTNNQHLQHNKTTTQQHNNTTTQQHNNTTTQQQHNNNTTTAQQQHNNSTTTQQQHNNNTTTTHNKMWFGKKWIGKKRIGPKWRNHQPLTTDIGQNWLAKWTGQKWITDSGPPLLLSLALLAQS